MKTSVRQISLIKRPDNTWLPCQKSMSKLVELAVTITLKTWYYFFQEMKKPKMYFCTSKSL